MNILQSNLFLVKPHTCDVCLDSFYTKMELRRHRQNEHEMGEEGSYKMFVPGTKDSTDDDGEEWYKFRVKSITLSLSANDNTN